MGAELDRATAAMGRIATSPVRVRLAAARKAAAAGDGNGVAAELAGLPERERFVATLGIDLLFPATAGPAAQALDATVPKGRAVVDWTRLVSRGSMQRWVDALARTIAPEIVASLVARAFYASAGDVALGAVRGYVARGQLTEARVLERSIDRLAKSSRAVARALIALAEDGSDAGLTDAVHAASGDPIVQDGGEEVEALAALLEVLGGTLPASHPAVAAACAKVRYFCDHYVERKDVRSYGASLAVLACARGAARDPGWLDHARSLRGWVWGPSQKTADEAIAAAEAGGVVAPAPARVSHEPRPLAEVRTEPRIEQRSSDALEHVARAADAGDLDAGLEALAVAIEPTVPSVASPAAVALFAHCLPAARAASLLVGLDARALPEPTWRVAERVLGGADAVAFVDRSIALGRVVDTFTRDAWAPRETVAAVLAALAATTGDEALGERLLAAASVTQQYEDRQGSENERSRSERVGAVVAALAPVRGLEWVSARLAPTDRPRLAAAASQLAKLGLTEAVVRCERIEPREAVPLAAALAAEGALGDALTLAASLRPSEQARALLAMAQPELAAPARKKLLAAMKKAPKASRDRDDQRMRAHQVAQMRLRLGDVDEALALLADLGDCRYSGHGPAALASEIATWLDAHPDQRTPERVEAVLATLASGRVIAQELVPVSARMTTWAIVSLGAERAAPRVREIAGRATGGDAALALAGEAAGLAQLGEAARAREGFEAALRTAPSRRIFFSPFPLVRAAETAGFATSAPELFVRAVETIGLMEVRDYAPGARTLAESFGEAERALVRESLGRSSLAGQLKAAMRSGLAAGDARRGDVASVLRALEAANEPAEVVERVAQLGAALAARGDVEEAFRVGALVGITEPGAQR